MGQRIRIDDIVYELPTVPNKADILFSDQKKPDQYWRRQEDFPQTFYDYNPFTIINSDRTWYEDSILLSLSVEDTEALKVLQDREMKRRIDGVWFMNNGEPTYLTGAHYFSLQWCQVPDVPGNYLGYRKFQRDFYYAWDACMKDENSLGLYNIKPKKTGISQLVALIYLEESTRLREKRMGVMSKSGGDAQTTNFMYYLFALERLPFIFMPRIRKENESTRVFGVPRKKDTGTKSAMLQQIAKNKGLNTEVFVAATVEDAFDGPKMWRVWLDEFPKYVDPYPNKLFTKTQETVKMDYDIVGKMIVTSYVVEDDGRNFDEAKDIWNDSKMGTKDPKTNRTKSGLYTFFISALDSGNKLFDKYGNCDTDERRRQIMADRAQKRNDKNALQAYIRQYPITEEEAWRKGGASGSAFDNIRLAARDKELADIISTGQLPFTPGYFRWKDNIRLGFVEFVPLSREELHKMTDKDLEGSEKARFFWYLPHYRPLNFVENDPLVNNRRDRRGHMMPNPETLFIGAVDPTDFVLKEDVSVHSKNALSVYLLPDIATNTAYGHRVTDRFLMDYLFRHNNPEDFYEDVLMAIIYFGMYVYIEANKPWLITKLKEDKMHNFILYRSKKQTIEPYEEGADQHLTTTVRAGGVDVIEDICRAISTHISKPVGDNPDNLQLYYSRRAIEQYMSFRPTATKLYDLAMACGLNLVARNAMLAYRLRNTRQNGRYDQVALQTVFSGLIKT